MLKKLAFIGILTGVGQLFSLFVLKFLSNNNGSEQVAELGQADALSQFIINLIAFGLQSATMRDIALHEDWKGLYMKTQQARLTLCLFVSGFVVAAYYDPAYFIFAVAPLIALSGDYALYSTGHSLTAAIIAFLRVTLPFGAVAFSTYIGYNNIVIVFIISFIIVYGITNIIISRFLKVRLWVQPSLSSLKLYIKNVPLGLVTIALYFIGFGLVTLAPYVFTNSGQIALLVAGLKFYMLYKGLLRIIHQVYLRQMSQEAVQLAIDKAGTIAGTAFMVYFFFFPETVIKLFFGINYVQNDYFFQLLGLSAWVYSLFSSVTTTVLLKKQDLSYSLISITAACVTILLFIFLSLYTANPGISVWSIVVGELLFAILMIRQLKLINQLKTRFMYAIEILVYTIFACAFSFFTGDSLITFIASVSLFALIILLTQQKLLKQMQ
jgi:O-antigen/teichoic acid export membrane protein